MPSHPLLPDRPTDAQLWDAIRDLQRRIGADQDGLWDDLRFPATGINPPGAVSDPTRNTTTGLFEFSKSAINVLAGVAQMPHDWREGSGVRPHVHYTVPTAATGNLVLKFEYEVVDVNGTITGTYAADTDTVAVVSADANVQRIHGFAEIDMTGRSASTNILWKFSRVGDSGSDDYDDIMTLLDLDFHYIRNSFGSQSDYLKTFPE